jgi:hypothetical protein
MRKRNLSEFMCIEMLYDYKSEKLDALRKQAVEEGLQASPRVREELRKLSIGMSYCEKLKSTRITEPLVDFVINQPKPAEKFLSHFRWKAFPQPVRWAFEAILVAVAISLFVTQMPELFKGHKKSDSGFVVKKFDLKPTEPTKPPLVASKDLEAGKPAEKPAEKVAEKAPTPTVPTTPISATPLVLAPTTPIAKTVEPVPVKPAEPAQVTAAVTPESTAEKTAEKPKVAKKGNAYLYRMIMQVDNADKVTPQVTALITSLGGEKAGEVELGWRRRGGSYYHFTLPKANNQAFQDGLKKFGVFSMVKSAHPRVMPEDTERFILWLEERKPAGATTPKDQVQEASPAEEESTTPDSSQPVEQVTPENTDPQ